MNTEPIVIDAKNLIVGRLASHLAKQALLGSVIEVINIDQTIYTGNKRKVLERFKQFREMGTPTQGPFIHRSAVKLFKRTLKKMLPYKTTRGQEALKRIKVFKGVPIRLKEAKTITLEKANVSKVPNTKYITLQDVTNYLGGK
jgi:large subunit ribosomal protein L13